MRVNRVWVMVGVAAVAVVVAVSIFLIVNRPWESREYKSCLRQAQNYLGEDYDQSEIEAFCHAIYE